MDSPLALMLLFPATDGSLVGRANLREKNAGALAVILDVLKDAGAGHAVFGGLAAAYYGHGRMTADVDLLVPGRFFPHVCAGLERRGYLVRQFPLLVKMYVPGDPESAGDLVMAESNSVLNTAFTETTSAIILGLPVNIVRRGVLVALKFQAVLTPRRRLGDRTRDVMDIRGVMESGFEPEDQRQAARLVAKMYPGAEADFVGLLNDVRRGRWPRIARHVTLQSGLLVARGRAILGSSVFSRHR